MMIKMSKRMRLISGAAVLALGAFLFFHSTPEEKGAAYLRRGTDYLEQGDLRKARLELKNAARLLPTNAEVSYRFGMIEEADGNFQTAFRFFKHAEEQNPRYMPGLLKQIQYYILAEELDEAENRVKAILSWEPNNEEANALLSAVAFRRNNMEAAETQATYTLGLNKANVTASTILASVYINQKKLGDAEAVIVKAIELNPHEFSLYQLKAAIHEHQADMAKIESTYHDLFTLKPIDPTIRYNLSAIYKNAGKLDDSEKVLRDAEKTLADNWQVKHQLVTFLRENRGFDAAEKELKDIIAAYPKQNNVYFWLADLYLKNDQHEKAALLLKDIIDRNDDDTGFTAKTSLARLRYGEGNEEIAKALVSSVLQKDPSNRDALYAEASMAYDDGNDSKAIASLRSILKTKADDERAFPLMAEVLLRQGHTDLAIDSLNQALDLRPDSDAVRVRLAQLYGLTGKQDRTKTLLAQVIKSSPDYVPAWETSARMALDNGDFATVEKAIDALSQIDGQADSALYLKALVAHEKKNDNHAFTLLANIIQTNTKPILREEAEALYMKTAERLQKKNDAVTFLSELENPMPSTYTLMAETYISMSKKAEAKAALDNAIRNHASSQKPFIIRAQFYREENDFDNALSLLAQANDVAPSDPSAALMSADIFEKLNRNDEALATYEMILEKMPSLRMAANNWAALVSDFFYTDVAKLEKARQTVEQFVGSDDPIALDTLAWIYFRQGNYDQAQTIMTRAIKAMTIPVPQLFYHHANILFKTGNHAQAKEELSKAVATDTPYPGLQNAREMLTR